MKDFYPHERYEKPVNLRSMVRASAEKYGDKPLFKYISKDGSIGELSYKAFYENTKALGTYLAECGMSAAHMAILSESRTEWITAYVSAICVGGVAVPLDKELLDDELTGFIDMAQTSVLFFSGHFAPKVRGYKNKLPNIKYFVCFDADAIEADDDFLSFDEILARGYDYLAEGSTKFTLCRVDTSKMCAIIFTSGTTGTSKGVMLSQDNILTCVYSSANMVEFTDSDVIMSVLPWHHTYELSCGILTPILIGLTVCINNNLKYFMKNAAIFKPTGLVLVPLFVTTIYKKIQSEIKKQKKERLIRGAVVVTRSLRKIGIDMRNVAFAAVKKALGGKVNKIICGGAALEPDLVDRFDEFGIRISVGYGITECSPLVGVNPYMRRKYGSAGIPIKGSHCKVIVEDDEGGEIDAVPGEIGEIVIKGPHVMLGYYKNPEATKASFSQEGYYKSGDYGYIDHEGYIFITGRKKNIIVLANGKNVYPEEVEEYLMKIEIIDECVVVSRECDGEEVLTAVIHPSYELLEGLDDSEIIEKIKAEVALINKKLPIFKQIRNIELKKTEFAKTTSKKILRHKIDE